MIPKRRLVLVMLIALIATTSFALPAREFNPRLRRVLDSVPDKGTVTFRDVHLGREQADTIELERMEVWAKDAKIRVFGAPGQETILRPPDVKYFKGRVLGEPDSAVFFSMSADRSIRGLVIIGERRWSIGSGVRKDGRPFERTKGQDFAPILISQIDEVDELTSAVGEDWECQLPTGGSGAMHTPKIVRSDLTGPRHLKPVTNAGDVAGATYQMRIAFETDNEFCAAFSNDSTAIATYVGDLVGKMNIVYERDLDTTVVAGDTHIRNGGSGTDPWAATTAGGTFPALAEFGTYWHNNYSSGYPDPDGGGPATAGGGSAVARSSAVFLSGRLFSAGVAWLDVLCGDNFFCGTTGGNCGSSSFANSYGGAYAFNGSSGSVATTNPDPEATVNGVQYGLPATSNYWMLLEVLHELGHNVGGPHTQCIALTAEEKTLYSTTRDYVDECYNRDGAGCYGGTTANCNLTVGPGADPYCDAPPEKGTVMSYCHNIFVSGFRQSRYLFGQAGEPSAKVLTMFNDVLEAATPNPTITAQAEPVACSAGRTASVAVCSGCTYAWQITGGTITSSSTSSSITYTPTENPVTLTVTVITSRGCGITASKTIATSCVAVDPPTSVTATATSTTNVNVSWLESTGATSYNVYRSTDGLTYSLAGNTATTSFNDGGRTADTAYLYKVRAVNGGESADSNIDLATTTIFTDDPLVAGTTLISATHVTQLRTAVEAVRALAGIGAGTYTDPTLTAGVTTAKAAHVNDLRTALDAARADLGLTALNYGETVTATVTTIDDSHFTELRNGVK